MTVHGVNSAFQAHVQQCHPLRARVEQMVYLYRHCLEKAMPRCVENEELNVSETVDSPWKRVLQLWYFPVRRVLAATMIYLVHLSVELGRMK